MNDTVVKRCMNDNPIYGYYSLGSSGFELTKITIGITDLGDRNCEREDLKLRIFKGYLTAY
jgi:hypothetical protein